MFVPKEILTVWKKFDDFGMENLTKAWYYNQTDGPKQRSVELMEEHYHQYGLYGNCFDLTIWLLHEFRKSKIEAYPIGHDLKTKDAHVAIVALDEKGFKYLCDLGDQWIIPILIDPNSPEYTEEILDGFFPGAKVQVKDEGESCKINYYRHGGKLSQQSYSLKSIDDELLISAGEHCQGLLERPLCEKRIPYKSEIAHWEFYNWQSFVSTSEGLFPEPKRKSISGWSERIRQRTGMDKKILQQALHMYLSLEMDTGIFV